MDIYAETSTEFTDANNVKTNKVMTVTGPVSRERIPSDWNNGPGPEEYYLPGAEQSSMIYRLLMHGNPAVSSAGGIDIPRGDIYGIRKVLLISGDQFDMVPVGLDSAGFTRTPNHNP